MKKAKEKKIIQHITICKTQAIKLARYALRMNDKTLKLKNVQIYDAPAICKCQDATAVKLIADTCFRNDAEMVVGVCKKHANIIYKNKRFEFNYKTK
jgi:hypothetical protein